MMTQVVWCGSSAYSRRMHCLFPSCGHLSSQDSQVNASRTMIEEETNNETNKSIDPPRRDRVEYGTTELPISEQITV